MKIIELNKDEIGLLKLGYCVEKKVNGIMYNVYLENGKYKAYRKLKGLYNGTSYMNYRESINPTKFNFKEKEL